MDETKYIRFIDSRYNTLFHVPDGGSIKVHSSWDGKDQVFPCRYIDEYHFEVSGSCWHICQFAEFMECNGNTYAPVSEIGDLGYYKKKYLSRRNLDEDGLPIPYYVLISVKSLDDPARTETNFAFCFQPENPDKAFCRFVLPAQTLSDLQKEFAGSIEEQCNDQKVCSRVNDIVEAIKANLEQAEPPALDEVIQACASHVVDGRATVNRKDDLSR